jgi:hypothetical protein
MANWVVGLDLGQASDPSALAAVEQTTAPDAAGRKANHYSVRYLRRFPLGTSYPLVVSSVCETMAGKTLAGCPLAVDQTGVGRAVVDMFRAADLDADLWAVTITAGSLVSVEGRDLHVPKKELVSALQVPLQTRRFAIAQGLPDAGTLAKELANFRVKITAAANETFGAWREGQHDDLLLAVAMAVWLAERLYPAGGGTIGLPPPNRRTLVPLPGRR